MTSERLAYRPTELADAMGVSRQRVYEAIREGTIRTILAGSRIRIPASEAARIAEEGMPTGTARAGRPREGGATA